MIILKGVEYLWYLLGINTRCSFKADNRLHRD